MSTQTLQIVGKAEPSFTQQFERLYYYFGSGFQRSVLVGHSGGERSFKYVYVAPDRTSHVVTDPENGSASTTWIDYLIAFHRYRMVDGEPFNVTDQTTGSTMLVMFAGDTSQALHWQMIGKNVYGVEIMLKQYRAP